MSSTIESLSFLFTGDDSQFQQVAGRVSGGLTKIGAVATGVGAVMSGFFGLIGRQALMAAGQFEQTTIAFDTMLGSARETKNLLSELTEFAALTPFEMPEILQATRGLVQFGERGEELMETLNFLGNAASGTSQPFGMIALIFNQVRGVGKLLTQDFRQLSTRGVLSLQDVAKHFGISVAEAQQKLSEGKITFEDFREILKGLSDEGGRFNNLMEKQSQSFLGLISTFKDAVEITIREIGQELLPLGKAVINFGIKIVEGIRALPEGLKKILAVTIGLGFAFGTLLTVGGGLIVTLGGMTMAFLAMIPAAVSSGVAIWTALAPLLPIIIPVGVAIAAVAAAFTVAAGAFTYAAHEVGLLQEGLNGLKTLFNVLKPIVEQTFGGIMDAISSGEYLLAFKILIAGIKLAFLDGMFAMAEIVQKVLPLLWKAIQKFFMLWVSTTAKVTQLIISMAQSPRKAALLAGQAISQGLLAGFESGGITDFLVETRNNAAKELDELTELAKKKKEEQEKLKEGEGEEGGKSPEEEVPEMSEAMQSATAYIDELTRMKETLGMTNEEIKVMELRKQGVDEATIEHIINLQKEIAAEKEAMATREQAKRTYESMVESLGESIATMGMSREELELYKAEQAGLSEIQIDIIKGLQKTRKEKEEDLAMQKEALDIVESLKTEEEKRAEQLARLDAIYAKGLLTAEQYAQAQAKIKDEYVEAEEAYRSYQDALSDTRDFNTSMEGLVAGVDALSSIRGKKTSEEQVPFVIDPTAPGSQAVTVASSGVVTPGENFATQPIPDISTKSVDQQPTFYFSRMVEQNDEIIRELKGQEPVALTEVGSLEGSIR